MRNFTRLCVFLLFISCCWSGCGDRSVRHRMLEAEARFDTVPSDIFRLLSEVGSPDSLSSEDRALYDLLTLRSYSIGGQVVEVPGSSGSRTSAASSQLALNSLYCRSG